MFATVHRGDHGLVYLRKLRESRSCISKRRFPPTEVGAWCAKWFIDSNTAAKSICAICSADWLAEALDDPRLAGRRFDLVVPVPLHPARQRERGFNQAELLAAELRRVSGLTVRNVLQRTRYTTTQTQFDRSERMENLRGAFRLRRGSNVQDLRMLLVDDVLTTGSTLSECASVLREAGALSVHAVTAARG